MEYKKALIATTDIKKTAEVLGIGPDSLRVSLYRKADMTFEKVNKILHANGYEIVFRKGRKEIAIDEPGKSNKNTSEMGS